MMPLYEPLAQKETLIKDKFCNTGLWYDKFCNTWPEVTDQYSWSLKSYKIGREDINPKQAWLKTVTGRIGESKLLGEACERQRLLAEARGVKECVQQFSTVWRFVTGLGRQHPVENGFAWHHTLGVPYLPGSSIKGMMRAWAEQWEETKDVDRTRRIFGPKKNNVSVGNVIFFDALPMSRVNLEEDVMTPHYSPYYQNGKDPGDWYDPVPIPFLTVAADQAFQFTVAPRSPHNAQSRQDAEQVMEWLEQALAYIGAGAKNSSWIWTI